LCYESNAFVGRRIKKLVKFVDCVVSAPGLAAWHPVRPFLYIGGKGRAARERTAEGDFGLSLFQYQLYFAEGLGKRSMELTSF
jgi:hypothetical protein